MHILGILAQEYDSNSQPYIAVRNVEHCLGNVILRQLLTCSLDYPSHTTVAGPHYKETDAKV